MDEIDERQGGKRVSVMDDETPDLHDLAIAEIRRIADEPPTYRCGVRQADMLIRRARDTGCSSPAPTRTVAAGSVETR